MNNISFVTIGTVVDGLVRLRYSKSSKPTPRTLFVVAVRHDTTGVRTFVVTDGKKWYEGIGTTVTGEHEAHYAYKLKEYNKSREIKELAMQAIRDYIKRSGL